MKFAMFVHHEAWDKGKVFLGDTEIEAEKKAWDFIHASVGEYWNGPGHGEGETIEEWTEMCLEQGNWTVEEAEVMP